MRRSGEITVFLSMCLLCVSALICVMVEGARTAGSRYYFQVAVNGGLDTLFSRYHRGLWEEYRILALEYRKPEELKERLEGYVNRYLETENWYPVELNAVDVTKLTGIGDQSGDFLAEEVLSYMKYGIVADLLIPPEKGEQFLKDVKEGDGVSRMTRLYSGQEREVRKLEQAVEKLAGNIEKQEKLKDEIEDALSSEDVGGFYRRAEEYRRAAKGYPRLMKSYQKQAEALAQKQAVSREEISKIRPDLQEDRGRLLEEQWNPYDAYIKADGARYTEFASQESMTERNLGLLSEVEDLVEELLEEETEEGDESGGEDERSLEPAAQLWSQYRSSRIPTASGSPDKEKQNLLDQVQRMAEGGLTQLVMPEGTVISQKVLDPGRGPYGNLGEGNKGVLMAERVLVNEYCGHVFRNAAGEKSQEEAYEMEYLLQGERTDRENLEKTLRELFAMREGLNLLHILSDGAKREQARALALMITGGVGLAPLAEITACLVMGVWAMGESVQDLRILMSGGKVPLWKETGDWKVSLEGLLDMGRSDLAGTGPKGEGKGFDYEGYLKLLLLKESPAQKHMRMLDLMQMHIRRKEPGFLIDNCVYGVEIQGKACGNHVFFALPFVETMINGEKGYPLEAVAEKAY